MKLPIPLTFALALISLPNLTSAQRCPLPSRAECESGACEFDFRGRSFFDPSYERQAAGGERLPLQTDPETTALLVYLDQERDIESRLLALGVLLERTGDSEGAALVRELAGKHAERIDEVFAALTGRLEQGEPRSQDRDPTREPDPSRFSSPFQRKGSGTQRF